MLCGVRLLDKSRDGRENNFRLEVWTKFNSDSDDVGIKMKQYIETKFAAFVQEENKESGPLKISFVVHKQTPKQGGMQSDKPKKY